MTLHRLRLRLDGPYGTPFSSGTLFGHLCWAMLRREGEGRLVRWLDELERGEALCLVSDGLPAGLLPRPKLPRPPASESASTADADAAKQRGRLSWIGRNGFLKARGRLGPRALDPMLAPAPGHAPAVHAHNRIHRQTGTTPETAGLFFVEDRWPKAEAALLDLYVETTLAPDQLGSLVTEVGAAGFGRDATTGRGRFTLEGLAEDAELAAFEGTHRLSLSHGCLCDAMRDVRFERFTHFGKVGVEMAQTGARPFKLPVLLMRPGATFRPKGPGPFGRLLRGVHQDRPEIVHHALHLAVPYTEDLDA